MRRLLATSLAVGLAGLAAGCGKPEQQAADASSTAPAATSQASAPGKAEMKAALAALPAPYNAADLDNGETKFALCASCHTITPGGPNLTGPNLHSVAGHKAGAVAKYNYSAPMKASGLTWDGPTLDAYLTDPRAHVPGTKMSFIGLKDPKDRTDVIAYLMVNSR